MAYSWDFHRKIRRSEGLIARRAFGSQGSQRPAGGSANPEFSPSVLLIFL
jgi:hypothetical protein